MHPSTTDDLRFWHEDGHLVAAFPDEVDLVNAAALRFRLLGLLADHPAALVLDLSATRFCDSSGIEVIFRAQVRATELDIPLHLVLPPGGPVRTACAITGVTRVIPNFTDVAEARAALPAR